jgi:hypothetical protein
MKRFSHRSLTTRLYFSEKIGSMSAALHQPATISYLGHISLTGNRTSLNIASLVDLTNIYCHLAFISKRWDEIYAIITSHSNCCPRKMDEFHLFDCLDEHSCDIADDFFDDVSNNNTGDNFTEPFGISYSAMLDADQIAFDDQDISLLYPWDFDQPEALGESARFTEDSTTSPDSELIIFTPLHSPVEHSGFLEQELPRQLAGSANDQANTHSYKKKRKWDDSIVIFSAKTDEKVTIRKRKRYGNERKKQVAAHRLVGACIQCKLRKGSVSENLVMVK